MTQVVGAEQYGPDLNQGAFGIDTAQGPDYKPRDARYADFLQFAVPSILAGAIDTFGQSLGLSDEDDVENFLMSTVPSFGDYYSRHKTAAQTVGDLTGMFIPGTLAAKIPRLPSIVTNVTKINKSRLVKSIFNTGKRADRITNLVKARDRFLASRLGSLNVLSDSRRRALVGAARKQKVTDAIVDTVAFELGVLATMNASDTLYPDEFSTGELLALNAVFPAAFAGVDLLHLNKIIRGSAQQIADLATAARNPGDLPLEQIFSQPGNRDLGVTTYAMASNKAEEAFRAANNLPTAQTNFRRDVTVFDNEMKHLIQNLGTDNVEPLITRRANLTKGQVENIMTTEKQSPGTVIGTFSAQHVPNTFENIQKFIANKQRQADLLDKRIARLNKEIVKLDATKDADKIFALAARRDELAKRKETIESAELHILDRDGTLMLASEYKPTFYDVPNFNKLIRTQSRNVEKAVPKSFIAKVPGDPISQGKGIEIGFSELGNFVGVKWNELTQFQKTAGYATIRRAVDNYTPGEIKIAASLDQHHTKTDYMLELYSKYGERAWADFVLPPGIQTIDDLEFLSLQSKFKEYTQLRNKMNDAATGKIKLPPMLQTNMFDIARQLNLPTTPDGSIHPVLKAFETIMIGDEALEEGLRGMEHFRRLMQEEDFFPELTPFNADRFLSSRGNMMTMPLDRESVMLIKRPVNPMVGAREHIQFGFTAQRSIQLSDMANARKSGANLVQLVYDELTQGSAAGAAKVAKQINNLIDGTQRGSGAVLTQLAAIGENPVLQAMFMAEQLTDKAFRQHIGTIFEQYSPVFNKLRARNNTADLNSFNLYTHMRRQRWDLKPEPHQFDNGNIGFVLDHNSKFNQNKFSQLFGQPLKEGTLAPAVTKLNADGSANYVPFSMTQLAFQGAKSVDELSEMYLRNTNQLRKILGRGPLRRRPWHVPPRNFARQEVVYLMDDAGQIVSVHSGRTMQEANRRAQQELDQSNRHLFKVEQKDVSRYFNLTDGAFANMVNFSDALAQTGTGKGKTATEIVDIGQDVLNDIVQTHQRNFESILRRSRAIYFQPEMNFARTMLQRAGDSPATRTGQSVWQKYVASIMGNPLINPNEIVGQAYFNIESIYDKMLNGLWDRLRRGGVGSLPPAMKSYDNLQKELSDQLGEYNPFQSTADMIARTYKVSPPPSMKKHMANLNWFTSALTLRFLDVAHSLLTMTSLGATLPGVVKALRKFPNETPAQHAARVGAFGLKIDDDNAMFHPTRALTSTMHFIFTEEGRKVWRKAAEAGYMNQTVSEIFRTLAAPQQGYHTELTQKLAKFSTFLSDKSEELSRGLAFMTGYNIAKRGLKMRNDETAFAFAHRFANETIGDYAPNNRPRMFQGAVGMPIGLFMTFIQNYYQRLFSYIEAKDIRSLAVQTASQASIYGAQTVPGFQHFADIFASNYDGSSNLIDGLENRFGTEFTEWFLYGTLSNMPKLFGLDDGLALYQRGDVTIRSIPTVFNLSDTPNYAVIRDFIGALREGIQTLKTTGGLDDQRISEILSAYSTNRFVRNMASLYAAGRGTGVAVDRRGAVINQDVLSEIGIMSRLLGLRPLSEARKNEKYYRLRSTEASQRARVEALRDSIRSKIRGGLTQSDLDEAVGLYVKYGGNPQYFSRWFENQLLSATVDRTQREFLEAFKDPTRSYDVLRLMSVVDFAQGDPEFAR